MRLPLALLLLPLLLAAPAWAQSAGEPCSNSDGSITTQAGHDPTTGAANDLLACIGGAWKSMVGIMGDGSCAAGQVSIVTWSGDGSQKIRQVSCKLTPDCAADHKVLRFNGSDFWCDDLANAYNIPTCKDSEVLRFDGSTFTCATKHDSCLVSYPDYSFNIQSYYIPHGTAMWSQDAYRDAYSCEMPQYVTCVDGVLIGGGLSNTCGSGGN